MASTVRPLPSKRPQFPLKKILSGTVTDHQLLCRLNEPTCSLCAQFLEGFLGCNTWPDVPIDERWEKRTFTQWSCSGETAFRWVFHRYRSSLELRESTAVDCVLCKEVLRVTDREQTGPVVFTSAEHLEWSGGMKEYEGSVWGIDFEIHSLNALDTSLDLIDSHHRYNIVVAEDALRPLPRPGQPADQALFYPNKDSDSQECFDLISKWCSHCLNSHKHCHRPDLPLPSRLLDVSPGWTTQDQVALCESGDLVPSVGDYRYLALSYCWGKGQNYQTTSATIASHKQSIPVQGMPAVLQDAITITRRCGFRYLWIDAMCIVQDDLLDWKVEAARMGDVYAGSVFTISALSSAGCDEPILGPRNLVGIVVGSVSNPGDGCPPLQLWIRTALEALTYAFISQPLSRRAWCYQERLLAPGIVHFGRNQLI